MGCELRAQLAKGVYELYSNAYNLANDSLKKLIEEPVRIYLNCRRYYYSAIAFLKMKEATDEIFNKTGEGYGKEIAYIGLACDCLNAGFKDINKAASYLDVTFYNNFKTTMEELGSEMLGKNQRIYFQPVPALTALPKIEKIIKVNPAQIPDDLNKIEANSVLDNLVPREVKPMVANYKQQMMEYISEFLDKYENEGKVSSFLKDLGLPLSLETAMSSSEISDSLWKRISEVQQKGGSMYLTNQIANLAQKSEEVSKRIADIELVLYNEEEEDKKLHNLYGNRWNRQPSNKLNQNYYAALGDYKSIYF